MRRLLLSTILVLLSAACQSPVTPPADAAAAAGQIAFCRGGAILLLDVATGGETVLVANNQFDRPLHWLPKGDRLVYWNHDGGAWDLWSVDVASGARHNLTQSANDARSAAASPDGASIAFQRGGNGVWLMAHDGGEQRCVHELGHRDAPPVWSPSGQRLAFSDIESRGEGVVELVAHVVELRSGAATATKKLGDGEVLFFLDEARLVVSAAHAGRYELVAVDVTTGARRPLTQSDEYDSRAVLSPDRATIAWIATSKGGAHLRVMAADGSGARDLAVVENFFASPGFSPDGRWLVFESGPSRQQLQVFVVPVAGGPVRGLTKAGGCLPVWRPRG